LFFFSSRRRHTRFSRDWSSDVCSSDLKLFAFFFRNAFFKNCRSAFNHVFSFFQAKASRFTNCFNYSNFVRAERSKFNIEFSLFFSSSSSRTSSNSYSSSRYIEFLFEIRDKFKKFNKRFFS